VPTMTRRRLSLTLPDETLRLIDRVVEGGSRSRLVDAAVRHYVATVGRERLAARLKAGAQRRAARTRQVVDEWFPLDEEAWRQRLGD
jgi:metal-responsive CopG/Arc/MetJ family transcriptional regulator